jgi:hypothetical protein
MSDAVYGKNLSEGNIYDIVNKATSSSGQPYSLPINTNAVYFVLTAPDVNVSGPAGRFKKGECSYCGWHTANVFNSGRSTLPYGW